MNDAQAVKKQGSASDRVRLEEYFESVRSVEQRLEASMRPQKRWINQGKFPLDRPSPGIPETHAEHLRVMLDIFVLAFWSDTTRIGTFMLGDAQSSVDYSFLPGVQRLVPLAIAPRRYPGHARPVRKDHQLERGADGVLPEQDEEPRRRRNFAAR